jgi:hypothetical protein
VANPAGKNSAFGSTEFFIDVAAGRLNGAGLVKIPFLNPQEPFRLAASGQSAPVLLAGGDLVLNLADGDLTFPDGAVQGAVHAQFTQIQQAAYPATPAAYPAWVFDLQPGGIRVAGTVSVTMAIPKLFDSYDYVAGMGQWVILVALDPDSLRIVPVGVGQVDPEQMKVTSAKPIAIRRLDILGYALTGEQNQDLLEQYVNDTIGLQQMISRLQAQH